MFADLIASDNLKQIDHLRNYCVALALILVEKDLLDADEFDKYLSRATHLIDQADAQRKEEVMNLLFGKSLGD